LLDDGALELGGNVHHQVFHRLHLDAVFDPDDNFRLGNGQLETFATHVLDQDRQVQFTAARNLEGIGAVRIFHPQGDVDAQFLGQTFADVARGDPLAFTAGKGGGIDDEVHGECRLVDGDVGDRDGVLSRGQGLADAHVFESGYGNYVAGAGLFDF